MTCTRRPNHRIIPRLPSLDLTHRRPINFMIMDTRKVRLATLADASAIVQIYNQGIAERIATFETDPRAVHQIEAQLMEKGDRYPTIVVEQDGQVAAWATAGPYRSRPVYAGVAEHSVYVARHARGTGAGR